MTSFPTPAPAPSGDIPATAASAAGPAIRAIHPPGTLWSKILSDNTILRVLRVEDGTSGGAGAFYLLTQNNHPVHRSTSWEALVRYAYQEWVPIVVT